MATQQLVARVPQELVDAVDRLIEEGAFSNRSDAVRAALATLVERRRREAVGEAIVAGYTRTPQDADEAGFPDRASAEMIAEEPW